MAATFRAAGSSYTSGNSTPTTVGPFVVPAGVVATDWCVLVVSWVTGSPEPAGLTPSGGGWTVVLAPRTESNAGWAIYAKTGLVAGDTFSVAGPQRFWTASHVYYSSTSGPAAAGSVTGRGGVSGATTTAPAVTTTEPAQTVLVVSMERTTATGTTATDGAGVTRRLLYEGTGNSTCSVYVGERTGPTPAGPIAATTTTYNSASGNGAAVQVPLLAEAAPEPPDPTLTRATQALPGPDRLRAAALTADAAAVRLAVSASAGMTSPTYGAAQVPDAQGYTRHEVTGLAADTDYWWQMELDGALVGPVGRGHTLPPAGPAASYSFAVASCAATGSADPVFTAIRTRTGPGGRRPLWLAHQGDIHYAHSGGGSAPNDPADHRSNYEAALQSATQAPLYRDVPLSHSWSDNDFCGSNSDSTAVGRPAAITVRRQLLADPVLPDTAAAGLWTSWVVGRVRFIRTDSRTYMSLKTMTDGAGKSMLGAEQKAWLKDQLAAPQPVKVWFHDNAWSGPGISSASGVDTWQVFQTERNEIAAWIAANRVRVLYVHGDAHRLSADDGTSNAFGAFPVVGVSPADQQAQFTQPVTAQQAYPSAANVASAHHYGWFDVTDSGTTISIAYSGVDAAAGVERVALTTTWTVTAGTAGESDTARPARARHVYRAGRAADTSTVLTPRRAHRTRPGRAGETDTATSARGRHALRAGRGAETDAARPARGSRLSHAGRGAETGTGLPAAARRVWQAGIATATDLVLAARVPAVPAGETDTALPGRGQRRWRAGVAAAIEQLLPAQARHRHRHRGARPVSTSTVLAAAGQHQHRAGLAGEVDQVLAARAAATWSVWDGTTEHQLNLQGLWDGEAVQSITAVAVT